MREVIADTGVSEFKVPSEPRCVCRNPVSRFRKVWFCQRWNTRRLICTRLGRSVTPDFLHGMTYKFHYPRLFHLMGFVLGMSWETFRSDGFKRFGVLLLFRSLPHELCVSVRCHLQRLCSISNCGSWGYGRKRAWRNLRWRPKIRLEDLSVTSHHPHKVPVPRLEIQSWSFARDQIWMVIIIMPCLAGVPVTICTD
jgi:hypothetical protein